jgi:hypothetical protein
MKVKILTSFICLLLIILQAKSQVYNMNSDPNGTPWLTNDALLPGSEFVQSMQEFVPTAGSMALDLPSFVYNEALPYFSHIIYQPGASCVQVAEIWYTFDYEINRKNGDTAGNGNNDKTNLYHPLFTYNFLNGGDKNSETQFGSGFDIIKQNGCPSWEVYNDPVLETNSDDKYRYWMTGQEKYKAGMSNRIDNVVKFSFDNPNDTVPDIFFEKIKHWLADHGNASSTGGLAIIGVYTDGWNPCNLISMASPQEPGSWYIKNLGTTGSHALTIVGYNDDIWIEDINHDGQFTDTLDVTGDGKIDMRDYEKGAFKVANSWGIPPNWLCSNDGFTFIPYRFFYENNPGFIIHYAYGCEVFENNSVPQPSITVQANLTHPNREKINCTIGYADVANALTPTDTSVFNSFNFQGGAYQMRGAYTGPIEIGLNHSYFFDPVQVGKVFFEVNEHGDNNNNFDVYINSYSLLDYRWGEEFELPCTQENVPIINNGETTLSIEYHLLPHESPVTTPLTVSTNRVSRFTTTVANGAVMSVNSGASIDMYNSEIHIEQGGQLGLGFCYIRAKQGNCRIVVDGTLTTALQTFFEADSGATLEIVLNNPDGSYSMNGSFSNCQLTNNSSNFAIQHSFFTNCPSVRSYRGNVAISNNNFENTGLWIEGDINTPDADVTIEGNQFNSNDPQITGQISCIFIDGYAKYKVSNNSITNFPVNGIQISCSGFSVSTVSEITVNTITGCGSGIDAYNSKGIIGNNRITGNRYGVILADHSHIALRGSASAMTLAETQQISDNDLYEVYASDLSFPYEFSYNAIVDSDNTGNPADPLVFYNNRPAVYYTNQVVPPAGPALNVKYNCWGAGFNATQDLKTTEGYYQYLPGWCPGGEDRVASSDEALYLSALSEVTAQNYTGARLLFQSIVQNYPESVYAQASMKDIFYIEQSLSSDYENLKEYYRTNDSIQSDSVLTQVADIFINQCNVKLENWNDAIAWYENRIMNPPSVEDSIFAIIDLGYLYMQIQKSGTKSAVTGKLSQFIPSSKPAYDARRAYLLSLIPAITDVRRSAPKSPPEEAMAGILDISPNPFTASISISYRVKVRGKVSIQVTDASGRLITKTQDGERMPGTYSEVIPSGSVSPGLYSVQLIYQGQGIDTRKAVKLNR